MATYLAEIHHNTGVVGLARDIAETFRADLSDGVIQQSLLHFSPQYVGNPPGLPDVVMLTDNGLVPPMRTPPGVELTAAHGDLYFAVNAGIDMYTSKIFAGRLMIEYHSHAPAPEKVHRGDTLAALLHCRAACRNRCQLTGPKAYLWYCSALRTGGTTRTRRLATRNPVDARLNVLASKKETAISNRTPGLG